MGGLALADMQDEKTQFLALVDAELTNELDKIQIEVGEAISKAVAAGAFNSGARRHQVSEAYVRGTKRHRQEIFVRWTAYIQPRLRAGAQNEAASLSSLAVQAFDQSLATIQRRHDDQLSDPHSETLRDSFPKRVEHERAALSAATLLHAGLPQQPTQPSITVNHSGAYSPVSIGSGGVHQTVQTATMGDLGQALRDLAEAIRQQPSSNSPELLEVVVEAADEVEKQAPNKLRIGSLLAGAAAAVQTAGAVQPAWEAVKAAARALSFLP